LTATPEVATGMEYRSITHKDQSGKFEQSQLQERVLYFSPSDGLRTPCASYPCRRDSQ
jgi:hypothetical protein